MDFFYRWSAVLVLTIFSLPVFGQISLLDCPVAPTLIADAGQNDQYFYHDALLTDSVTGLSDLGEASGLSLLQAQSPCPISAAYLLYLDMDGDGVLETKVDSEAPPVAATILYNNVTAGTLYTFDKRPVPSDRKFAFSKKTETLANGDYAVSAIFKSPNGSIAPLELPYGKHRIDWKVTNTCGDTTFCSELIEISDGKAPTVICQHGVSINMLNSSPPLAQLFKTDVINYMQDNYSPVYQVETAVCLDNPFALQGDKCTNSFPLSPNGSPDSIIQFGCPTVGSNAVQVWARDHAGNESYCETLVDVQDNFGSCGLTPLSDTFCVRVRSICTDPTVVHEIFDFDVEVLGIPNVPPLPIIFNTTCFPLQSFPMGSIVQPVKDDEAVIAVNILDLLTIQKHLLGTAPLPNPYLLIAADANKSGSVTPSDIIELRKLILGIYPTHLPNNTAWRFVDESYVFPNPENPFADVFPEQLQYNGSDAYWFWGIKIGDVDCSFIPKMDTKPSFLSLQNQQIKAGADYVFTIKADNDLEALQGTLDFVGLELLAVKAISNCTESDFYVNLKENALTFAWIGSDKPVFEVRVRAEREGRLGEMIKLTDRLTPRFVFSEKNGMTDALELSFLKKTQHDTGTAEAVESIAERNSLMGNSPQSSLSLLAQPSVFSEKTQLTIAGLRDNSDARLRVFDAQGVLVFEKGLCAEALCSETLFAYNLPVAGLYHVVLETADSRVVQRVVRM